MHSLASYLSHAACSLRHLSLGRCGLQNDSALVFSSAIRTNHSLTHLNLSENSFHNDGGISLLAACEHHKEMIELEVSQASGESQKETGLGKAYRRARINQIGRSIAKFSPIPMDVARLVASYHVGDI